MRQDAFNQNHDPKADGFLDLDISKNLHEFTPDYYRGCKTF